MKERPILFSGPMVRAILEDRKTETRRVVEARDAYDRDVLLRQIPEALTMTGDGSCLRGCLEHFVRRCPYGQPGDRLWVRESILRINDRDNATCASMYAADGAITPADAWPWKTNHLSAIHCPRGLSRITLEVKAVRVERLQQITDSGALAEGITDYSDDSQIPPGFSRAAMNWRPVHGFQDLWQSINGKRPGCSWDNNPWVWVVEFERVR